MNLPRSLALPQSKLLRSPVGILILVAAVALIGVVAFFVLRAPTPAKLPTPATSPAAQALPADKAVATGPVVYGPPAPDWVKRDPSVVPVPPAAGAPAGAAGAVQGIGPKPATAPGSAPVAADPAPSAAATASPVVQAPAAPVAGAPTAAATVTSTAAPSTAAPETATSVAAGELPQVLDPAALFQREQYVYQAAGRRDPFQSLLDGKFQSQGDGSLADVGDMHLVGIMWGSSDKFALVEDSRGRGFVLRVGDPVLNGYISGISKTELQVVQNAFGDSQTVTIQLKSKEGDPNATRNQ